MNCEKGNAKMMGTSEMENLYMILYPVSKSDQWLDLLGEDGQAYYRIGAPWVNIVPVVHENLPLSAVTLNELINKSVFKRVVQIISSLNKILKYRHGLYLSFYRIIYILLYL